MSMFWYYGCPCIFLSRYLLYFWPYCQNAFLPQMRATTTCPKYLIFRLINMKFWKVNTMRWCGCPCISSNSYLLYFWPYCKKSDFTVFLTSPRLCDQLTYNLVHKCNVVVCIFMYSFKIILAIFCPILGNRGLGPQLAFHIPITIYIKSVLTFYIYRLHWASSDLQQTRNASIDHKLFSPEWEHFQNWWCRTPVFKKFNVFSRLIHI